MNLPRRLWYRAYQDFFMGSRLDEYQRLLKHLRALDYQFMTMAEFAVLANLGRKSTGPVCLLRNDVDSDVGGATRMFICDRNEGIRATYYFRLATIDLELIKQIVSHGGEVGYHFEEIASFAKRNGIVSREQIDANIELVRSDFGDNIRRFAARTGVSPRTIASHGDFLNRRLGVSNHDLLTRELMDQLGIVADAYDERIHADLAARFSDSPAPQWWRPSDPIAALNERPAAISILVHPRQWHCSPGSNFRLGLSRTWEEAVWRWRAHTSRAGLRPVRTHAQT